MLPSGLDQLLHQARAAGCPADQIVNFLQGSYVPQPRQLALHAAARQCDGEDGPDEIGFGGARGPGKSHAVLAQVALDDCRRVAGLKALYLRKSAKQAREQFDDLRRRVLHAVPHKYNRNAGTVEFGNGSRIFVGHFHHESDVDNYLGLEYDVIAIEECTTLSADKYRALRDSNRSSKPGWRPRIYNTTNPGGVGHTWYKQRFVTPARRGAEGFTRFIAATVDDNQFIDQAYKRKLEENTGWRLRAYRFGDWDIAAGMFFGAWREAVHVVAPFAIPAAWPVWGALDYGFAHPTVIGLFTRDGDGRIYLFAEHSLARALPGQHMARLRALCAAKGVALGRAWPFVAGADVFIKRPSTRKPGGESIAEQYAALGLTLTPADIDRVNGAGQLLALLGDPEDASDALAPRFFVFRDCPRTIAQIPAMVHSDKNPEDVQKVDVDESGQGGDDAYDMVRYGLMVNVHGVASTAVAPVDVLGEMDQGAF